MPILSIYIYITILFVMYMGYLQITYFHNEKCPIALINGQTGENGSSIYFWCLQHLLNE